MTQIVPRSDEFRTTWPIVRNAHRIELDMQAGNATHRGKHGVRIPSTQFIAGREQVLDAFVQTAATSRSRIHLETFKLGEPQAQAIQRSMDAGTQLQVMSSTSSGARQEIAELTAPLGARAHVTRYGESTAHDAGAVHAFSHSKLAVSDYERATVSTAALQLDDTVRMDWGLTVTGPPAAAAGRVLDVAEQAPEVQRRAMAEASKVGMHFNDKLVGARFASDAWMGAISSAQPGDRALVVTKKLTSVAAARALAAAHERGVQVEVIAGRTKDRAAGILRDAGVPSFINRWPGASLHGNVSVIGDQLLLGSMYLAKRPLGDASSSVSRELLVSTRDPGAVADAVRAIRDIPTQPMA